MTIVETAAEKNFKRLIVATSIAIPVVVALLFRIKLPIEPLTFLPPTYAAINGLTAIVLLAALAAVKARRVELHRSLMQGALALSFAFLCMYVAWHLSSDTIYYGDADFNGILSDTERAAIQGSRYFYYPLLISHIVLSIAVVPLVLFTYLRGVQFDNGKSPEAAKRHQRLARISYPIWLYVTVTGVIVYIMISPYYP